MKFATKTLTWAIVCTAVLWTACGSKEGGGKTKLNPGKSGAEKVGGTNFKTGIAQPEVNGHWLYQSVKTRTTDKKQEIAEAVIWTIKLDDKDRQGQKASLKVEKICKDLTAKNNQNVLAKVSVTTDILINKDEMKIIRPQKNQKIIGQTVCELNVPSIEFGYSISNDKNVLVLKNFERNSIKPLCRIENTNADVTELTQTCEAGSVLTGGESSEGSGETSSTENQGSMTGTETGSATTEPSPLLYGQWVNYKADEDLSKSGIRNYYLLELSKDLYTLKKVCFLGSEETVTAKVAIKAKMTGNQIILENEAKDSQKIKDQTCEIGEVKETWNYTVSEDGLTLYLKGETSNIEPTYYRHIETN